MRVEQAQPLLLIILDGWGYSAAKTNNAIAQANTPNWDKLWNNCPHILLSGSGLDVGLPAGQMGNSEVGHMTLGSGRVIYQDLTLINKAIDDGSFFTNPIFLDAILHARQNNKALHILGLLSPGGVHSHEKHILAMLQLAEQQGLKKIYLHAFLDGRDTPPQSAGSSIKLFDKYIASIMGRFYAMDRDHRIERTQAAVDLLIKGQAPFKAKDATQALQLAYARGETDEFVQPTIIHPIQIEDGESVIFMNFRADRARQLSHALTTAKQLHFVTLTDFDPKLSANVAFTKANINHTLSEILAAHKLRQLHIAETEKYAHVTFFFNAGKEAPVENEDRMLIPSPKVATYDLQPGMSSRAITAELLLAIKNKKYDVIVCNFANADMVGHTGNLPATIAAIEILDDCLGQIASALQQDGGQALITADHGNAETMWDETKHQPHTAHTINLVPFLYVGPHKIIFKDFDITPGLQDVAPTILQLLNIAKPSEMTGNSLIQSL